MNKAGVAAVAAVVPKVVIPWLQISSESRSLGCGRVVGIWEVRPDATPGALALWAHHLLRQYAPDLAELDADRTGTGLTREAYLLEMVFPSATSRLGPSVRSGEFVEVLALDHVEHVLGFWGPRIRFANKEGPDHPAKGCDVLGFRGGEPEVPPSPNDTLLSVEAKGALTRPRPGANRLRDALADSGKDFKRQGYSLHALKRHLRRAGDHHGAARVERFQDEVGRPFRRAFGVFVLYDEAHLDAAVFENSTTVSHPHADAVESVVVARGADLMELVHRLYALAAELADAA